MSRKRRITVITTASPQVEIKLTELGAVDLAQALRARIEAAPELWAGSEIELIYNALKREIEGAS